jgi:hypothetical protein
VNERALKEFQAIARGFETIKNREERKKAELGAWRRVYTDAVKLCS